MFSGNTTSSQNSFRPNIQSVTQLLPSFLIMTVREQPTVRPATRNVDGLDQIMSGFRTPVPTKMVRVSSFDSESPTPPETGFRVTISPSRSRNLSPRSTLNSEWILQLYLLFLPSKEKMNVLNNVPNL